MYITLLPAILAGILNMIWCRLPVLTTINVPIDFRKNFSDGKRIFGDNKTWRGFVGMMLLGCICAVLWGFLCDTNEHLTAHNYFYARYDNTFSYNIIIGLLIGLSYALFELPNSFIKRRLNIVPGKTHSGILKIFFIFFDQADSLFGCVLIICIFYPMTLWFYMLYVFIGAATHIVINTLLYFCGLRKNMF
ncbi:MAG: CDP-archaeol synthase [Oscillospiraceae bacterium]